MKTLITFALLLMTTLSFARGNQPLPINRDCSGIAIQTAKGMVYGQKKSLIDLSSQNIGTNVLFNVTVLTKSVEYRITAGGMTEVIQSNDVEIELDRKTCKVVTATIINTENQ